MKFSDPKGLFLIKLNRINLPVADVAASRNFFASYFGMKTTMELGRGAVTLMRDEGDMVLMLSHSTSRRRSMSAQISTSVSISRPERRSTTSTR
jgi:predicted lactoylglutathione lyase